ncbi:hypothetical protein NQ317_013612 [Molorchus minor]|uniref:Uncharacterized protein n=1 Tax=Molorchus minor TaxID=1323400 RepID=A0ABQ9J4E5_9CUCU|nr:hypothetical protein NQ317_013612 [Molorchus minor]
MFSTTWAGDSRAYLKPSFGGTEVGDTLSRWQMDRYGSISIVFCNESYNKPSSTLTTGNVSVNIVKVIQ